VQRDSPPPDDDEDLDAEHGDRADATTWAERIRRADPRLRPRATPPRWRDPRDLAAEQSAESRAARAEAEAAAEPGEAGQEESQDESEIP
jgi:hypothetical protein